MLKRFLQIANRSVQRTRPQEFSKLMLQSMKSSGLFTQRTVGLETISKGLVMPIVLVSDLHKESQDGETQRQDADNLGSG